jgi:hypothetical protein
VCGTRLGKLCTSQLARPSSGSGSYRYRHFPAVSGNVPREFR